MMIQYEKCTEFPCGLFVFFCFHEFSFCFHVSNIAEAMGHTPEVHWQNYARFKPDATTEMYRNRNKQISLV